MIWNSGFYATDAEVYYFAPSGKAWLVASEDGLRHIREVGEIPPGASPADNLIEPEEADDWLRQIEAASGDVQAPPEAGTG